MPRLYYEREPRVAAKQRSKFGTKTTVTTAKAGGQEFFAVSRCFCPRVYSVMSEALYAASEGAGTLEIFHSRKEAQAFVDASSVEATTSSELYVIWVGRKIGVLSKKDMLQSVCPL